MAIRLTENKLRQIIKEEVYKMSRRGRVSEMAHGGQTASIEKVADLLFGAEYEEDQSIAAQMEDEACRKLAVMYKRSPTPSADIANDLIEQGYDEDSAVSIGDAVESKYMNRRMGSM